VSAASITETPAVDRPLLGVHVLFVAASLDTKTREGREARALAEAGATVEFLGIGETVPAHLQDTSFPVTLVPDIGIPPRWSQLRWKWACHIVNRLFWIPRMKFLHAKGARNPLLIEKGKTLRADVVHAADLMILREAACIARSLKAKLVYDMHEYWRGHVKSPLLDTLPEYATRLIATENKYISRANLVLVTSETMKDRIIEDHGPLPCHVLYNAPWTYVTANTPVNTPLRFVHLGVIVLDRNIHELLNAFSRVYGACELHLHGGLWGNVSPEQMDELLAKYQGTCPVFYHGEYAHSDISTILANYDVGVYTATAIDGNFDVTLPNKLFDYLCNGLAVVMPPFESIERILADAPCGVTVDTSSTEAIATCLQGFVDSPELVEAYKKEAVAHASQYAYPEQAKKLVAAYADMMDRNTHRIARKARA